MSPSKSSRKRGPTKQNPRDASRRSPESKATTPSESNEAQVLYSTSPRTFDVTTLCTTCPPTLPVRNADGIVQGTRLGGSYVSARSTRNDGDTYEAFCQSFGMRDKITAKVVAGTYRLDVGYRTNSKGAVPPSVDTFVDRAEQAATRCSGPVFNTAVGAMACGAVRDGLHCTLAIGDQTLLPHPDQVPSYVTDDQNRGIVR